MNRTGVEVRPVQGRREWRRFFDLRRELYRDDPHVAFPFRFLERQLLDPTRNAFFQHAEREAFLAWRDGRVVGRIVAIRDQLNEEYNQNRDGFFGFFEAVDDPDVARELLAAAEEWLDGKGCTMMRGPVNPSMKGEFGLLVEGFEHPPFLMMAHTLPYYPDLLAHCGLEPCKSFFCFRNFVNEEGRPVERWSKVKDMVAACRDRFPKLTFRTVNQKNFDATIREINELGNRERAANYGFVPLTEGELKFMISQLRKVIRMDMIVAAYWEDRLVGYIVSVPDVNWAYRKSRGKWDWLRLPQFLYWVRRTPRTRVIALGVDSEFRTKGIAITLIDRLIQKQHEFADWEFSWVVEDNLKSIRVIQRTMGLVHYKTYRLYEKPIGRGL